MKKLIIVVLSSILFASCPGPEAIRFDATYKINNESGNEVKIRIYELFDNSFEDHQLFNNSVYSGDKIEFGNQDAINDPNNSQPTTSYSSDSIVIFYNNEKKKVHYITGSENGDIIFSNPINRNVLRGGNYTNIGNDIYEIILTEEDYNNAEDCGGPCE